MFLFFTDAIDDSLGNSESGEKEGGEEKDEEATLGGTSNTYFHSVLFHSEY